MAGIDLNQAMTRPPEEINQRPGLVLVRLQPLPHHRLAIILANDQRHPIQIANSSYTRRTGTRVIQRPTFGAHPSSRDTVDNYIVINHEMNHHLVPSQLSQEAYQNLGLLPGP